MEATSTYYALILREDDLNAEFYALKDKSSEKIITTLYQVDITIYALLAFQAYFAEQLF